MGFSSLLDSINGRQIPTSNLVLPAQIESDLAYKTFEGSTREYELVGFLVETDLSKGFLCYVLVLSHYYHTQLTYRRHVFLGQRF